MLIIGLRQSAPKTPQIADLATKEEPTGRLATVFNGPPALNQDILPYWCSQITLPRTKVFEPYKPDSTVISIQQAGCKIT